SPSSRSASSAGERWPSTSPAPGTGAWPTPSRARGWSWGWRSSSSYDRSAAVSRRSARRSSSRSCGGGRSAPPTTPPASPAPAGVARPPYGVVDGNRLTIHNIRNFDYRSETDFTERWETRSYDLSQIDHVDLFMSYWGSPAIAHTIMSWAFSDGQHLAISIETRKEVGESYDAVAGFFRQYELYYVVSDAPALIRPRT